MVALSVSNAALMVCTRDLSRAFASILRARDMFLLYLVVAVVVLTAQGNDAPAASVTAQGNDSALDDGVAYSAAFPASAAVVASNATEAAASVGLTAVRWLLVRSKGCGSGGGGGGGNGDRSLRRCCVSVRILSTLRMSWNSRRPTSDDDSSLQLHGLNGVHASMLIDRSTLAATAAASAALLDLAAVGHPSPSSESSNRFRLNGPRPTWPSATADTSTPESSLWSVVGV